MRAIVLALAVIGAGVPVAAQKKPPRRPAAADSNDARAYYRAGLVDMEKDAEQAEASLYWATRLQPTWAQALYLRRVTELRADDYTLVRYYQGDRKARRAMQGADSLLYRARMIEPFLLLEHDRDLLVHYLETAITADTKTRNPNANAGELRYAVTNYIRELMQEDNRNHVMAGWLAFSERRYPEALDHYAKAIGSKHESPGLHDDRATMFFVLKQYDSAAAELRHAVNEMKKEEKKEDAVIYRPKALLDYRLAHVFLMADKTDSAKAALGRALEEDLAFYPAHITLASMALAHGDSAGAKGEMDLAVQLQPTDPYPFMRHADLAIALHDYDQAAASLKSVIALEPFFAEPHRLLGLVAEAQKNTTDAIEHYRRFLSLTVRDDRAASVLRDRIKQLGGVQ